MPTTIPVHSNTYVKLHELSETQLNIGEVQISGLSSTCGALGKLLTREIDLHNSAIKTNKAKELAKEINSVSLAIDKHLVNQIPVIKAQMQDALTILIAQENTLSANPTSNLAHPYMNTIRLLQQKIVQIDQQLRGTTQRVLKVIPNTKRQAYEQLVNALAIYQSTLCGVTVLSTELGRLSIFLTSLKSIVELYAHTVPDETEQQKLRDYTPVIEKLTSQSEALANWFRTQTVNNLPIKTVYESAKQKHSNLSQQLTAGDLSNPGLVLAVAQRHETGDFMRSGLQNLRSIQEVYETLSKNVVASFEKFRAEDINALANELIQSEANESKAAPASSERAIVKRNPKAVNTIVDLPKRTEIDSWDEEKPVAIRFDIELAKLADWLSDDVSTLKVSRSHGKRAVGHLIAEQLQEVYGQLESERWPAGNEEVLLYKADIEQRLSTLEQLIGDAMAQSSPPLHSHTPPSSHEGSGSDSDASPSVMPRLKLDPPAGGRPRTPPTDVQEAPVVEKSPVIIPDVKAPAAAQKPSPKPAPLDSQLQQAIQKLTTVRTKIFEAYSRQESFRQQLLLSSQPHSVAWVNINQTAMVLDFISHNIAYQPHAAYVKPYEEHRLPMAEMIRSIQAERNHPHFNQRNCQTYLEEASKWLDTFTPHIEYLDQLLSVSESMINNNKHPVA